MANTKTQKEIKIAKTKSEDIFEFVVDTVKWQTLKDELNYSKATLFRYKTKLKEIHDQNGAFEALSEVFTIKEMNTIIKIFNDFKENPEKYEKKRKKKDVDLSEQKSVVNKHLSSMDMKYDEDVETTNKEDKE